MNIVFIETPGFIRKIDRLASLDEIILLQDELTTDPCKGKIIKGTGGARKIRMRIRGSGKSGGARVIYYFVDLRGEIWFLDMYAKSDKSDLTEHEKGKLLKFIKEIIQ